MAPVLLLWWGCDPASLLRLYVRGTRGVLQQASLGDLARVSGNTSLPAEPCSSVPHIGDLWDRVRRLRVLSTHAHYLETTDSSAEEDRDILDLRNWPLVSVMAVQAFHTSADRLPSAIIASITNEIYINTDRTKSSEVLWSVPLLIFLKFVTSVLGTSLLLNTRSMVEITAGVICGCVPNLQSFFRYYKFGRRITSFFSSVGSTVGVRHATPKRDSRPSGYRMSKIVVDSTGSGAPLETTLPKTING